MMEIFSGAGGLVAVLFVGWHARAAMQSLARWLRAISASVTVNMQASVRIRTDTGQIEEPGMDDAERPPE